MLWANLAVSGLVTALLDQGQAPRNTAWLRAQSHLDAAQNDRERSPGHSKIAHRGSHKGSYLQGLVTDNTKGRRAQVHPEGPLRLRSTQRGPAGPVLQGMTPGGGVQPPGFKRLPVDPSFFQVLLRITAELTRRLVLGGVRDAGRQTLHGLLAALGSR